MEECSNFGGKIEIPAAMQYLLPKADDYEVSMSKYSFLFFKGLEHGGIA